MKKILCFCTTILMLQSCTIKEEYTISNTGDYRVSITYEGNNLKSFVPNTNLLEDFGSDSEMIFNKLNNGLTVSEFVNIIKEKESKPNILSFLNQNDAKIKEFGKDKIYVDINDYNLKLKPTNNNENSTKTINFLNELFAMTEFPLRLNEFDNSVKSNSSSFVIQINQVNYQNYVNDFKKYYSDFDKDNFIENFLYYELIINSPKRIQSSPVKGNYYNLEGNSMTYRIPITDIISGKVKEIKLTY